MIRLDVIWYSNVYEEHNLIIKHNNCQRLCYYSTNVVSFTLPKSLNCDTTCNLCTSCVPKPQRFDAYFVETCLVVTNMLAHVLPPPFFSFWKAAQSFFRNIKYQKYQESVTGLLKAFFIFFLSTIHQHVMLEHTLPLQV